VEFQDAWGQHHDALARYVALNKWPRRLWNRRARWLEAKIAYYRATEVLYYHAEEIGGYDSVACEYWHNAVTAWGAIVRTLEEEEL